MRSDATVTKIDTLILNAGRGGSGKNTASVDGREAIIHVNLLGHALLTAELLPLLKRSDHVRIATQSSGARFNADERAMTRDLGTSLAAVSDCSPWDQYAKSKAGACLLAKALTTRLAAAGVKASVSSADPGLVATGVNVQHDLSRITGARFPDTKGLHDAAAMHAGDGALPITLAALQDYSAFYSQASQRPRSLAEAAAQIRVRRDDPAGWPEETVQPLLIYEPY
jgi:NAD(P)-dependent dehydrogenase (short-subunit alcohol dehydrogenase family)